MSKIKYCSICNVNLDPYDTYQQRNELICGDCYRISNKKPDLSHEEIKQEVITSRTQKDSMVKDFIIVTVPEIKGKKISKYYSMITAEVVIGTGFFSSLEASVFDMFGTTGAYSDKFKTLKASVYNDLINQATSLGANAIVGTDAEYMNIGSNMIMLAISGTPVLIEDIDI